ncbi:unnamed protein product [Brassica napus]|uniref:(rape) hypothetical protein n=1 Tax=Brassica napus TaxID=3708 RepID=A0A816SZ74_BRANA|nr:unnamed protein product [Brassica napus]
MCRPSQTTHLTMSSARIDPPKRVLGLKEVVVTPPLNHGVIGLESNSTGSSFPADSAKPVPLAVVSLDSIQGHFNLTVGFPLSVPVLSWLFDARGKIPKEPFPVRPPADTRRSALATSAAEASRQQDCSPWRPDAVMSTTGRDRHSVLRIYKGCRCNNPHEQIEFCMTRILKKLFLKKFTKFCRPFNSQPSEKYQKNSEIVHHLSGPDRLAHTRTLLRRSRSVVCAPLRDPANQLPCALRVYPPVDSHTCQITWSVFQKGSNGEPTGRCPEHTDAEAHREARAAD